jgi:hypothetical protein
MANTCSNFGSQDTRKNEFIPEHPGQMSQKGGKERKNKGTGIKGTIILDNYFGLREYNGG